MEVGDADITLVEVEGIMLFTASTLHLHPIFAGQLYDKVAELARLSNSLLEIWEQGCGYGEGFKIRGTSLDNYLRQSLN